jgi:hypothetical protein
LPTFFLYRRLTHRSCLRSRAEELAGEIASQATTVEELNGLMQVMMKSALERMLDTEMDVHLGRKTLPIGADGVQRAPPTISEPRSSSANGTRSPNRRNGRLQWLGRRR